MTTFRGPAATQIYRLVSLKHQLKLEALGLHSSGGAIRPRIAAEFGLTERTKRETFIFAIDRKIEELQSQLNSGDIEA